MNLVVEFVAKLLNLCPTTVFYFRHGFSCGIDEKTFKGSNKKIIVAIIDPFIKMKGVFAYTLFILPTTVTFLLVSMVINLGVSIVTSQR